MVSRDLLASRELRVSREIKENLEFLEERVNRTTVQTLSQLKATRDKKEKLLRYLLCVAISFRLSRGSSYQIFSRIIFLATYYFWILYQITLNTN